MTWINMGVLPFVLALIASVFLILIFKRIAAKVGLVDHPEKSEHKTHQHPAALVGGISIFIAFCFALLLVNVSIASLKPLLAATVVLVVVGVLDDLHELSPVMRFISQIVACSIMIFLGQVQLHDLGALMTDQIFHLSWFSIPFTVFAVVGVINAFNMSDGMDGQSATLSMSVLAVLILLCHFSGDIQGVAVLCALLGAVLGFMLFNFRWSSDKPASVFMGDAGSMFLGFLVSWYLIDLSQGEHSVIKPITAVWILAVPICDTLVVMVQRAVRRKSPLLADRTHYHHLLQKSGFSINQVLLLILVTTLGFAGLSYVIEDIAGMQKFMFYGYLLFLAAYYFWSAKVIKKA